MTDVSIARFRYLSIPLRSCYFCHHSLHVSKRLQRDYALPHKLKKHCLRTPSPANSFLKSSQQLHYYFRAMAQSAEALADARKAVAYYAVDEYVKSGMVIGLGTGRTAYFALQRIGEKLKSGELKDIVSIPTSEATQQHAIAFGIPLSTLEENSNIDVALDGADEVDASLNLVKGRGGALLRERLVEECAKEFIVMIDETKYMKEGLGSSGAIPIEVTKFSANYIATKLSSCSSLQGCKIALHMGNDGKPYETDNGNYIINVFFKSSIPNVAVVADQIMKVTGVVHHGLFLEMATRCVMSRLDGTIETLSPDRFSAEVRSFD